MWRWYTNAWIGEYPVPFKPTLVEFIWIYLGAPAPIREDDWRNIENYVKACTDHRYLDVAKARGREDVAVEAVPGLGYDRIWMNNILDYARIRDKHPLRKPAAMTFEHFL